jgi:predicted DNA-binding protein
MSNANMSPTPVRFSEELIARVDGISKSTALSHASVLRLAINQWFEAGGDKKGLFAPVKKAAKKAAKNRVSNTTY